VAQTGHILRLKHRPGNVHDSKQAVPILRGRFGSRVVQEFRMDAAFFQRGILQLLAARGYLFRSMRIPPFFSSRLSRLGGRNVLRLTKNPETDTLYGRIAHRLAA
jgi:Transposase DDE domain